MTTDDNDRDAEGSVAPGGMMMATPKADNGSPPPKADALATINVVPVAVPDAGGYAPPVAGADARPVAGVDARADGAVGTPSTPGCANPDYLLCEDFESGALNSAKWKAVPGGMAVVEKTHPAHGSYALHTTVPKNGTTARIVSIDDFAFGGQTVFVRTLVYFDQSTAPFQYSALRVGAANGQLHQYDINFDAKYQFRMLWYKSGGGAEPDLIFTNVVPQFGSWHCWEWEIRGATNEVNFAIDGKDIPGMHVPPSKGWVAPPRARLVVGSSTPHPDTIPANGLHLYFDDIVISTKKIGCPAP